MPYIEIHCKGRLDPSWSDWFQGLTIQALPPDATSLSGAVPDNAAIYGIISTMSSLGLTLVSCNVEAELQQVNTEDSGAYAPAIKEEL